MVISFLQGLGVLGIIHLVINGPLRRPEFVRKGSNRAILGYFWPSDAKISAVTYGRQPQRVSFNARHQTRAEITNWVFSSPAGAEEYAKNA